MAGLFIFIIIFLIILASKGIRIVKQAQVMMVERLGKFHAKLDSGIHFIIPFLDTPRGLMWRNTVTGFDGRNYITQTLKEIIDLRESVYDFPKQSVITSDNVNMQINALLYFQITDPFKAVYEIENLPDAIEKLTQTTLRNVIGELSLDQTLTSRDTVNVNLRQILDEATDKWGVKVNRVELQDIIPPKDIKEAMEKQMRAERTKRAQILEAEGTKKAKILEAEGQKESAILEAEGVRQRNILTAEGEAEAKRVIAQAESEVISKILEKIPNAEDTTKYLLGLKYIEAFKEISSGKNSNKTIFMPYESSAILSSIGSIKELMKDKKS